MAVRLINLLCWFILIPSARANPPFIKIILFFFSRRGYQSPKSGINHQTDEAWANVNK